MQHLWSLAFGMCHQYPHCKNPNDILVMEALMKIIFFCRKLKLDETIANIWPEFSASKKDMIKVKGTLDS